MIIDSVLLRKVVIEHFKDRVKKEGASDALYDERMRAISAISMAELVAYEYLPLKKEAG